MGLLGPCTWTTTGLSESHTSPWVPAGIVLFIILEDGAHGTGMHSLGLAVVTGALTRVKHRVPAWEAGGQRGSPAHPC